jgi:hypothetical protein
MFAESGNVYLYVSYVVLKRKFCLSDKRVGCVLVMSTT